MELPRHDDTPALAKRLKPHEEVATARARG
jgi:hypothetical protein